MLLRDRIAWGIYKLFYKKWNKTVPLALSWILNKFMISDKYVFSKFKNIIIKTYDGSDQVVHPDIVETELFAGYKFWLAINPYPYKIDLYENPCIYCSGDGDNWHVPEGLSNPLDFPTKGKHNHLSDPDLLYYAKNRELILFYRESINNTSKPFERIISQRSKNGVDWVARNIIGEFKVRELLSPAVVEINEQIVLFHIDFSGPESKLIRRYSENGVQFGSGIESKVYNMPANKCLWHISMFNNNGVLMGLFVLSEGMGGVKSNLYFGYSMNQGNSFEIKNKIFVEELADLFLLEYRGALLFLYDNMFKLYFSAQCHNRKWYLLCCDMILNKNFCLVPSIRED